MDPAGPGFYLEHKLSKMDANFVDVIHTSGLFGLIESIGHSDFWPNLGYVQPGCEFDPICSHRRSHDLFFESISSPSKFQTSTKCESYFAYFFDSCECKSNCNHLGFYTLKIEGDFYLKTNAQSPYSIENKKHSL